MKKVILLTVCCWLVHLCAYSQVGIGVNMDTQPEAGLHIKGASDSTYFRVDDELGKEIMRVTKTGQTGIHTSTPTRMLDIDTLRVEGLKSPVDTTQYRHVLATDVDGNIEHLDYKWFIRSMPLPKTLKYTAHTGLINDTVKLGSITELGLLRIRYDGLYIYFQVTEDNDYTLYWEKSGDAGIIGGTWAATRFARGKVHGFPELVKEDGDIVVGGTTYQKWEVFKRRTTNATTYVADNFNCDNRDIATAILLLNNSQRIYRITALGYKLLAANPELGLEEEPASITFFIEELR